jgi:hypothetical protein
MIPGLEYVPIGYGDGKTDYQDMRLYQELYPEE